MALLEILKFPNPKLREVSQPIKKFTAELKTLAENMIETMYEARGIGLAAPQVGELIRMLVIDTRPRDVEGRRYKNEEMSDLEKAVAQPLVILNPEIVKGEGKTTFDEGCLSVPGYFETVERYLKVEIKGVDVNGKELRITTDGLLAICLQHEMDHLEGTLFIDHLSYLKSQKIKNQIKKHGYPKKEEPTEENLKDPIQSLRNPEKVEV